MVWNLHPHSRIFRPRTKLDINLKHVSPNTALSKLCPLITPYEALMSLSSLRGYCQSCVLGIPVLFGNIPLFDITFLGNRHTWVQKSQDVLWALVYPASRRHAIQMQQSSNWSRFLWWLWITSLCKLGRTSNNQSGTRSILPVASRNSEVPKKNRIWVYPSLSRCPCLQWYPTRYSKVIPWAWT